MKFLNIILFLLEEIGFKSTLIERALGFIKVIPFSEFVGCGIYFQLYLIRRQPRTYI